MLFDRYLKVALFVKQSSVPVNLNILISRFPDLNKQTALYCLNELASMGYLSVIDGGRGRGRFLSFTATNLLDNLFYGRHNHGDPDSNVDKTIDWVSESNNEHG